MTGLPSVVRVGLIRIGYDIRSLLRTRDQLIFSFFFPIPLLVIFSIAFGSTDLTSGPGPAMNGTTYYLPSMLAAGVLMQTTMALGSDIAIERHNGTLKRLGGTPLRPASYLIGKIGAVVVLGIVQAALVMLTGWALGAEINLDAAHWLTLIWVVLLGLVACAWVGIGLSAIARSAKSAGAISTSIVLVLCFLSGVYLPFSLFPGWLQDASGLFPARWLAQGARAALLDEAFAVAEPSGTWQLGLVAAALGIWLVVGAVWARLSFRWVKPL